MLIALVWVDVVCPWTSSGRFGEDRVAYWPVAEAPAVCRNSLIDQFFMAGALRATIFLPEGVGLRLLVGKAHLHRERMARLTK